MSEKRLLGIRSTEGATKPVSKRYRPDCGIRSAASPCCDNSQRVAVFVRFYAIAKSSPILCFLEFLSEKWGVDLYVKDVWLDNAPLLGSSPNIHILRLSGSSIVNKVRYSRRYSLYRHVFVFDPNAFVLAKAIWPQCTPFYYSLELYFRDNHYNLRYPKRTMLAEHRMINDIKGLIIQSSERDRLFRQEYSLAKSIETFILPVTYNGSSVNNRNRIYRERYSIPEGSWVVLHLGGIQEYHCCLDLARAIAGNEKYFLIFHGYGSREYGSKLKRLLEEENIKNVVVDGDLSDDIEGLGKILCACDIGLAWYADYGPNFTSAGKSSGKISAYLRFGLPVVVNRYQSTYEAIDEAGCGYCVDSFSDIVSALEKIVSKYPDLSERARNTYDKYYSFSTYKEGLSGFL